jgi:hypothetical protein
MWKILRGQSNKEVYSPENWENGFEFADEEVRYQD